jgi:hypothetical protein
MPTRLQVVIKLKATIFMVHTALKLQFGESLKSKLDFYHVFLLFALVNNFKKLINSDFTFMCS